MPVIATPTPTTLERVTAMEETLVDLTRTLTTRLHSGTSKSHQILIDSCFLKITLTTWVLDATEVYGRGSKAYSGPKLELGMENSSIYPYMHYYYNQKQVLLL